MSAMPEREVFATESNEQEWLVSYLREAMKMAEKLVPESRLLAAEAERDKWERISHGHFERAEKAEAKNHDDAVALADKMNTRRDEVLGQLDESWRYERDRANAAEARVREVEAAFKKYGDHWGQCPAMTPRRKCNCGYDQARAILAREAGK